MPIVVDFFFVGLGTFMEIVVAVAVVPIAKLVVKVSFILYSLRRLASGIPSTVPRCASHKRSAVDILYSVIRSCANIDPAGKVVATLAGLIGALEPLEEGGVNRGRWGQ